MKNLTLKKDTYSSNKTIYRDAETDEPVIQHTYGFGGCVTNTYVVYKDVAFDKNAFLNFSTRDGIRRDISTLVEVSLDDQYIYVKYNHPRYGWINKKLKYSPTPA
jgi:hypothetical protein